MLGTDIELDSSFHLFICLAALHLCLTSVGNLNIVFFSKVKHPGICPRGSTDPQLVMSMVVVNKP